MFKRKKFSLLDSGALTCRPGSGLFNAGPDFYDRISGKYRFTLQYYYSHLYFLHLPRPNTPVVFKNVFSFAPVINFHPKLHVHVDAQPSIFKFETPLNYKYTRHLNAGSPTAPIRSLFLRAVEVKYLSLHHLIGPIRSLNKLLSVHVPRKAGTVDTFYPSPAVEKRYPYLIDREFRKVSFITRSIERDLFFHTGHDRFKEAEAFRFQSQTTAARLHLLLSKFTTHFTSMPRITARLLKVSSSVIARSLELLPVYAFQSPGGKSIRREIRKDIRREVRHDINEIETALASRYTYAYTRLLEKELDAVERLLLPSFPIFGGPPDQGTEAAVSQFISYFTSVFHHTAAVLNQTPGVVTTAFEKTFRDRFEIEGHHYHLFTRPPVKGLGLIERLSVPAAELTTGETQPELILSKFTSSFVSLLRYTDRLLSSSTDFISSLYEKEYREIHRLRTAVKLNDLIQKHYGGGAPSLFARPWGFPSLETSSQNLVFRETLFKQLYGGGAPSLLARPWGFHSLRPSSQNLVYLETFFKQLYGGGTPTLLARPWGFPSLRPSFQNLVYSETFFKQLYGGGTPSLLARPWGIPSLMTSSQNVVFLENYFKPIMNETSNKISQFSSYFPFHLSSTLLINASRRFDSYTATVQKEYHSRSRELNKSLDTLQTILSTGTKSLFIPLSSQDTFKIDAKDMIDTGPLSPFRHRVHYTSINSSNLMTLYNRSERLFNYASAAYTRIYNSTRLEHDSLKKIFPRGDTTPTDSTSKPKTPVPEIPGFERETLVQRYSSKLFTGVHLSPHTTVQFHKMQLSLPAGKWLTVEPETQPEEYVFPSSPVPPASPVSASTGSHTIELKTMSFNGLGKDSSMTHYSPEMSGHSEEALKKLEKKIASETKRFQAVIDSKISSSTPAGPAFNLSVMADSVYKLIVERVKRERSMRGY